MSSDKKNFDEEISLPDAGTRSSANVSNEVIFRSVEHFLNAPQIPQAIKDAILKNPSLKGSFNGGQN